MRCACETAQRNCERVNLLAVSKTRSVAELTEAYHLGLKRFGENYAQEGCEKAQALSNLDIEWHFIGLLQSNKTKMVAEHFDWVHSLDRLKIAKRLSQSCAEYNKVINCCIQVNIDDEASKTGCPPHDVLALAQACQRLPHLHIRGLMAIPLASQNSDRQAQSFSQMYDLYKELQQKLPQIDTLSMGMSGDLEVAIAQGSTMVRVGTAIFGQRSKAQ